MRKQWRTPDTPSAARSAGWQDGIAGIKLPKPKAMGGLTADQVKAALGSVIKTIRATTGCCPPYRS